MLWVLKRHSFEHQKQMFKLMGKEILRILNPNYWFIWRPGMLCIGTSDCVRPSSKDKNSPSFL